MSLVHTVSARLRDALPWVLLVGGIVLFSDRLRPSAAFEVGQHLPEVSAPLLDGTRLELSQPPGQPLIVNFWASYCGPCRAEAPLLSELHRRGVRVIGLSVDASSSAQLVAMARDFGIVYPVGLGASLVKPLRVSTIPTTYVLAPNGAILLSRVGSVSRRELDDALALGARSLRAP